jgi:ABC-2 type transport system permease protein
MFVFQWFLIQLKAFKNSFKENKRDFLLHDVWHTVIILAGLSLFYIFLISMFHFIQAKNMPAFDFALIFLSFSLLIFMPLVFYSAIVCSLSFLFQKEEIYFYFSLPVNRVYIFSVKFIQAYFHTAWMGFLGLVTFLVAVQHYFKTTPLLYITGSLSFLIFLLIPVSLAVILVIVISRFFPFVRAKGVLIVIGLFVGSLIICAVRMMQPEKLVTAEGKMQLVTYVQSLHKPWMTALPSEWVTNILFAQIQKDPAGITMNFVSLAGLALICAALVFVLAKLFYKDIWAQAAVISPSVSKRFTRQLFLDIFPSHLRVFIRKDLQSFYRDTVEKGSLLILIPLCFLYFYSMYLLNRQIRSTPDPIFSFLYIYLFNFFYASVVIAGLSGRWVFPSVSLEGDNFKLIKGAAIPLSDFLKAKFLLGFIPLLFLGEILIIGSLLILGMRLPLILISGIVMAMLCYGITLLCLSLGMSEADFSIKEPLDFALGYKGFLCLVWECIYTVAVIVLVGIPTAVFLYKGFSLAFLYFLLASLLGAFVTLRILRHLYKTSLIKLSNELV